MQETLEEAIQAATGERVVLQGSGRTDAGAHAHHQVIAFSTTSSLPTDKLLNALNWHLPGDIAVVRASEVDGDFHPRYDATYRSYRYLIWNRPVRSPFWLGRAAHVKPRLDVERMNEAAQYLVGPRNLSSFIPAAHAGSRERNVLRVRCARDGDLVVVEITATGFLKQMVRAIVGTLIDVGRRSMSVNDFKLILESRDRQRASRTAPADGLYLIDVAYEELGEGPNGRDQQGPEPPAGLPTCEEKL